MVTGKCRISLSLASQDSMPSSATWICYTGWSSVISQGGRMWVATPGAIRRLVSALSSGIRQSNRCVPNNGKEPMKIKGIIWLGTRTDHFEQMTDFCRDLLGLKQTLLEPG